MPLDAPPRSDLEARLAREIDGDVLFGAFDRGRYATDASIYQIDPVGVVVPRTAEAARIAIQIAGELGVPVLPRGGGTSQCGQTVGAALVIDNSKHLNKLLAVEGEKDDISGVGQTEAALNLCANIPPARKQHHLQTGVGHYGVFNGSRFRDHIAPRIREFTLEMENVDA